MRNTLTIKVRLFSGLDKVVDVEGYDRNEGITLYVPEGTRLKKVVKMIGLADQYALVYFIRGERVGLWKKLMADDEIVCLRPAAGG